jgi:hypothetical protein
VAAGRVYLREIAAEQCSSVRVVRRLRTVPLVSCRDGVDNDDQAAEGCVYAVAVNTFNGNILNHDSSPSIVFANALSIRSGTPTLNDRG